MLAPKEFEQTLTLPLYEEGMHVAASKKGALRFTFPMSLLAAALAVYGIRAFWTAAMQPTMISYWLSGALVLLTGLGIAAVWLLVLPRRVKANAAKQFELHRLLYGRTTVVFTQDDMTLKGEKLTHRVEYAKTRLCVETSTLFVIFTDDDGVVLLEKAAFADPDATTAFLRDVFARWYKRKG